MSRHTRPHRSSDICARPEDLDILIARQPVMDAQQHTAAYQMLFRCTGHTHPTDDTQASAQVINSALNLMGLAELMNDHAVFIHVTPKLLQQDLHQLLPPGDAVLELGPTTPFDQALLDKCREVRDSGYAIALHGAPLLASGQCDALPLADYLIVDLRHDAPRISQVVDARPTQARVLARSVEARDSFETVKTLGCELFQGFFFARPHIVRRRNMPSGKQTYLRFLCEVNRPELDLAQLEGVIKQDAALTCKLLQYLNSALFGLPNKLSSIRQALALLGEGPLRRWASLLALTHIGCDRASELLRMSLIRGRFCESLGDPIGMTGREFDLFLMGLMSTLDAMLDMELHNIVPDLPLASDMKAAMLSDQTTPGKLCALAMAIEQAQWTRITALAHELGLAMDAVIGAQSAAMRWADQVMSL